METLKEIKIEELKENDHFKLTETKRKFHQFQKLISLGDNVSSIHKGKLLLILTNCKQLVVSPKTTVILKTNS
jgi:hypothetical protein